MEKYKPFLGTTTDREKAFPRIKSLTIRIVQASLGFSRVVKDSTYSKATVPSHERCSNPRCQQGGLDLQYVITSYPNGNQTFYCNGHEGSPQGRRKGPSCDNAFHVTLTVENDLT